MIYVVLSLGHGLGLGIGLCIGLCLGLGINPIPNRKQKENDKSYFN